MNDFIETILKTKKKLSNLRLKTLALILLLENRMKVS